MRVIRPALIAIVLSLMLFGAGVAIGLRWAFA